MTRRLNSAFTPILLCFLMLLIVPPQTITAVTEVMTGDLIGIEGFEPTKIDVVRPRTGVEINLSFASGEWRVLNPVDTRADQDYVEDLIRRLSSLTIADVLTVDPDFDYGLEVPQVSITLTNDAGESKTLHIGDLRSPVSLFVQPEGAEYVYAISNVTYHRIGARPIEFVDRTLVAINPADVVRVNVSVLPDTEDGESSLIIGADEDDPLIHHDVRRRGDVWMTEDGTVAFDVGRFLRSLIIVQASERLEMDDFPEDFDVNSLFFPAPGTAVAELTMRSGDTVFFEIGRTTEDGMYHYLRVPERESVYLLPRFQGSLIQANAANINDSLVFIDFDMVNEITILRGPEPEPDTRRTTTSALQQNPNETHYRRNSDGQWESNRSIVFNFVPLLDAISSIEAISAAPEDLEEEEFGFGTDEDAVLIRILFSDRNELILRAGAATPDGNGVYINSNEKEGVFIGDLASIDQVLQTNLEVRTSLFPLEDEVSEIHVFEHSAPAAGSDTGEMTQFSIERSGDEWVRNDGETIAGNLVQALLNELSSLSADSLAAEPDNEDEVGFYPHHSSRMVRVVFDDGSERDLHIGGTVSVGSGWFATINYYVSVSDLDDLTFVREQTINRITNAIGNLK